MKETSELRISCQNLNKIIPTKWVHILLYGCDQLLHSFEWFVCLFLGVLGRVNSEVILRPYSFEWNCICILYFYCVHNSQAHCSTTDQVVQ